MMKKILFQKIHTGTVYKLVPGLTIVQEAKFCAYKNLRIG